MHVIEHVSDVIRAMEEFHRVVAPGRRRIYCDAALYRFQFVLRPHAPLALNSFSFRYFGATMQASATIPRPDFARFPST